MKAIRQRPQRAPAPSGHGVSLSGFKAAFASRNFRALFWGQAVSSLGDWVGTLAFIAAADHLSGGEPLAVTVVLVLRLVPTFLATPIGGVISDRWDRRKIMIYSDLARFGVIALVPFLPSLALLYVLAFAHETFSLVFLPARDASVPNTVETEHLEAANAMVMGSSFAGIPLSGPVYAVLFWVGAQYPESWHGEHIFRTYPYSFAFVFDAFTFLVSAVMIGRIRLPKTSHLEAEAEKFGESLKHGISFIRESPTLRSLAYAVTVAMLGGGVLFALGIGYVHTTLGGNDVAFGWLMGLFGAGMVIGFILSQAHPGRGVAWMLRASIFLTGAVLIVMAAVPQLWLAYLMASVFGTAFAVDVIVAMSRAQAMTVDDMRGRVMAVVHMLYRGALVLGAVCSGIIGRVFSDGLRIPGIDYHADKNQVAMAIAGGLIALGAAGVRPAVDQAIGPGVEAPAAR